MTRFTARMADITTLDVDAIVNAANSALAAGGGVCGAIHRAAGPDLAAACAAVAPCPTGEARVTPGFGLRARHVIHAVGPVWRGGGAGEDRLLAAAYRSALALADGCGARSVAFPAISTGIYGYPVDDAMAVAAATVRDYLAGPTRLERVIFCCFDQRTLAACTRAGVEGGSA